jgi:hypothetical protein
MIFEQSPETTTVWFAINAKEIGGVLLPWKKSIGPNL